MEINDQKREKIRQLFKAISAGDFDACMLNYSEDNPTYDFPIALGAPAVVGKDNIRALYESMAETFQEPLQFTPLKIVEEDNVGIIEWEHEALTAKGSAYKNRGVHIITFNDDELIINVCTYFDTAPLNSLFAQEEEAERNASA